MKINCQIFTGKEQEFLLNIEGVDNRGGVIEGHFFAPAPSPDDGFDLAANLHNLPEILRKVYEAGLRKEALDIQLEETFVEEE